MGLRDNEDNLKTAYAVRAFKEVWCKLKVEAIIGHRGERSFWF